MHRVLRWLIVITIFSSTSALAGSGALEGKLATLLPKNAKWTLSVIDMNTGNEIMNTGDFKGVNPPPVNSFPKRDGMSVERLIPASLVKLFVAGAVFEYAESNAFDMTTTISYDGVIKDGVINGNLYIKGRGNALLSTRDIQGAVKKLTNEGLKAVVRGHSIDS